MTESPEINLVFFLGKILIPYAKTLLIMLAWNDMFSFSEILDSEMFLSSKYLAYIIKSMCFLI